MAPERFYGDHIKSASKESDVYSLAVSSFEVCFPVVKCPTIGVITPIRSGPHRDIAIW
jgi:hypothetical protein